MKDVDLKRAQRELRRGGPAPRAPAPMLYPLRPCRTLLAVLLFLGGCVGSPPWEGRPPTPPARQPEAVLYLVGDAGDPDPAGEPVLSALKQDLEESADAERLLVYLGDNIYPRGMPSASAAERTEAERRLGAQVDVAVATRTPTVFVPGNHDWDSSGPEGWEAIRRAEVFIQARSRGLAAQLPDSGCPGPATRDLGGSARVVLLDTEWWLRSRAKPTHPSSSCPADSEQEVQEFLAQAIDPPDGRPVVVAGHHPLVTAGPYGGHFGLRHHLFPLVDWKSWLWVPLPLIGSLYPLARLLGVSEQDTSGGRNRAMRTAIGEAFSRNPPLAYASGHVHTLQVLDGGEEARILVTSGAGIYEHLDPIGIIDPTLFLAKGRSGYAKLEFERDGRARLSIIAVDEDGGRSEVYAAFVDTG